MTEVIRYDDVKLRAQMTPEGYLRDSPVIGRSGIQEYRTADGKTRREYRPPDAVFHSDALEGLRGIPIVDQHPGLVNAANVRQHSIGAVLSAGRQDGNSLVADIVIHDPSAVTKAGRRELSLGYSVNLDETPGITPDGEKYDAIVLSIVRYDHLAIVTKGRAGNARLRLDGNEDITSEQESTNMASLVTVRLDGGLSYEAPAEVAAALTAAHDARTAATLRADAAEAALDAAKASLTASEAAIGQARADAVADVRARLELEAEAGKHGVAIRADATDRAIREDVVSKLRGEAVKFDGKSDDYVGFAFDHAITEAARIVAKSGAARAAVNGAGATRADSTTPAPAGNSQAARARMIANLVNPAK